MRRFAVVTVACLAGSPAHGGTSKEWQLSAACASCHNPRPSGADVSVLSGRSEASIARALRAYRSGARVGQIMQVVSSSLSLVEIDEVAQAIAAQPAQPRP